MSACVNECMSHSPLGDVPVTVEPGSWLCVRCIAEIGWLFNQLPELAYRVRTAIQYRLETPENLGISPRAAGSKPPLNVSAFDDCELLVSAASKTVWLVSQADGSGSGSAAVDAFEADMDTIYRKSRVDAAGQLELLFTDWVEWFNARMRVVCTQRNLAEGVYAFCLRVLRPLLNKYPEKRRRIAQHPRKCPGCMGDERTVTASWQGMFPRVACTACNWEFETDWGELLGSIGVRKDC